MKLNGPGFMAIVFLLTLAPACLAQTIYEVEGTVYGPDGKVIPNVTVSLQNHSAAQVDQDISKSDGRYRFANVFAGTYYLLLKPPDQSLQSVVQKIELIDSGVRMSNSSKERFDFTLKETAMPLAIPALSRA